MRMKAVLGFALLAVSLSGSPAALAEDRPAFAGANDKFTAVVMRASLSIERSILR